MTRAVSRTLAVFGLGLLALLAAPVASPKGPDPLAGFWEWKGPVDKNRSHMEFTVWIARDANAISGTYSVNEFVNGKGQGEDGNKTPFRGTLHDATIDLEFDATATVPGTEEDVTYTLPADGRSPSTATIVVKGATLEWTRVGGDPIEGIPDKLTLICHKK